MSGHGLPRNESGEIRPEVDASEQSKKRQAWFNAFETRLRTRLPNDLQAIEFQVTGSVAEGRAVVDSDVDIIIHYDGADQSAISRIKQEIISLLGEMGRSGETVFDIDIHSVNMDQLSTLIRMTMFGSGKN